MGFEFWYVFCLAFLLEINREEVCITEMVLWSNLSSSFSQLLTIDFRL